MHKRNAVGSCPGGQNFEREPALGCGRGASSVASVPSAMCLVPHCLHCLHRRASMPRCAYKQTKNEAATCTPTLSCFTVCMCSRMPMHVGVHDVFLYAFAEHTRLLTLLPHFSAHLLLCSRSVSPAENCDTFDPDVQALTDKVALFQMVRRRRSSSAPSRKSVTGLGTKTCVVSPLSSSLGR